MQARDHHQTNIKIRKWIPIGILCSLGLSACISASCMASSATITMGEMHGRNILQPQFGRNKGTFSVPITIHVEGAKDYTVSLKAENEGKLIDSATSRYILPTTSSSSVNDLSDRWGFYYEYGDSMVTDDEEARNYGPAPTTMTSILPDSGSDVTGSPRGAEVNKILTLGYAANLGDDFAAGTYKGTITVNVVASPLETIHDLYYMQDMSHTICDQTTTPLNTATSYDDTGAEAGKNTFIPRTMLKDLRDDHWYIVSKLADGNCWMTENLALAGGTKLTSKLSNVTSDYTLPASETLATNTTLANSNAFKDNNTDYVFNGDALDNSKYKSDTKPTNINAYRNTWNSSTNTGHSGAWYSWPTATAGEGKDGAIAVRVDATQDICPKGWYLPSGGYSGSNRQFEVLYKGNPAGYNSNKNNFDIAFNNKLSTDSDTVWLAGTWNYNGHEGIGLSAKWWSRTSNGDTITYHLEESSSGAVKPIDFGYRRLGYFVRCVAK